MSDFAFRFYSLDLIRYTEVQTTAKCHVQYDESVSGFDVWIYRGPVNEDVFAAPVTAEGKAMDSDIQDITEQIHRLLLQVSQYRMKKREEILSLGNYVF